MSLYKGTTLIAGTQSTFLPSIFDFKWTDHELTDMSWLRADTYSWQDGTVYTNAYNHLVNDIDGISTTTETIGSYTITYYPCADGHKVVAADQEATVANIYNESGVAWYYILDTVNTRFKLPRTKYGFTGLRDTVGKYVPETLPNIKGWMNQNYQNASGSDSGALKRVDTAVNASWYSGSGWGGGTIDFNASRSSSTYQDDAPVQQRATQMYLYFYVGQYSQSAIEQTAGLNAELFNGKVDLDAANLSTEGKSLISGLGMPSSRYIDLTLLASGSPYTAPANGYVVLCGQTTTTGRAYGIINESNGMRNLIRVDNSGHDFGVFLPVAKGQTYTVIYEGALASGYTFRFIYAEGDNV